VGVKIFAIFTFLFLFEIIFLNTNKFKDTSKRKNNLDYTDISFNNIDSYLITKDGVSSTLKASKVLKYKDRIDLFDINAMVTKNSKKSYIKADKSSIKEDIINLTGDVKYEDNNSIEIKSENLVYNKKSKIVTNKEPFVFNSKQGDINGNNLYFDQENGIVKAKNIRYKSIYKESK